MKYLLFIPMLLPFSLQGYELVKNSGKLGSPNYSVGLSSGLKEDNLKWNIAGPATIGGRTYNPDILSELEWKKLKSYYSKIALKGDDGRYALKLSAGYGVSYDGEVRDSDYLYSGRSGEFSRSISSGKGSESFDYLAALGYKYDIKNTLFILLVGYEWNEQHLKIKNAKGVIGAPTSAYAGLDSKYKTLWKGPYVGGDYEFRPTTNSKVMLGYSYHWLGYEGKGYWNLRADFAQNPSFKHTGNGSGHKMNMQVDYDITSNWSLNLKGEYRKFKIENGDDITYFSNGASGYNKLNEVKWESYALMLGVGYRF
ncbi:MAG: hypothetical protein ACOC08_06665 [Campylobacterales bacterium]